MKILLSELGYLEGLEVLLGETGRREVMSAFGDETLLRLLYSELLAYGVVSEFDRASAAWFMRERVESF